MAHFDLRLTRRSALVAIASLLQARVIFTWAQHRQRVML
jgi:hypothetical protein